jgi:all-trans-8'-apo-beta-carotenal 15,15'-oxygenase
VALPAPDAAEHPWAAGFRSLADERDYRVAELDGEVPRWLRGTLYRNGSGRNDLGGHWFPHWFDGDGMISAIRFDDAGVHYRNRYVRTENYLDETQAGDIVHRGFGKMRPGGVIGNAFRLPANVSNISLVRHADKLFSLWEGGPPYVIDPETLDTIGIENFDGKVAAFSAHPKLDPQTGELFNFGIDYGAKCTLTAYRVDRGGRLTAYPKITLPWPVMNHDFVLTQRYLVFCLGPILVHPLKMLLGFVSFDAALQWDGGRPTQVLLIPRDGSSEPLWIETDAFFQFHFANGFDEDGAVVLDMTRYPDFLVIGDALRNYWNSDWSSQGMASLVRLRIDVADGKVASRTFDTGTANEFPRMDPRCVAARHRYAYIANNAVGNERGLQQLLTRVDFDSGRTVSHDFRPHGYPGEPVFIPARAQGEEDDGCVVTLVYDAAAGRTDVVGLDARDLAARPLFVARLPHHVPFSLHGHFVPRP